MLSRLNFLLTSRPSFVSRKTLQSLNLFFWFKMKTINVKFCGSKKRLDLEVHDNDSTVLFILQKWNLPAGECYVTLNGKITREDDQLQNGQVYHVVPRVLGGKGGFGSMLRALGAQIEKTTNREACRDLSGRRMRDVNNAKKLQEWVNKEADREKERDRRRQERMERRRAEPRHQFEDPLYHEQKAQVTDSLEEALQHGLHKSAAVAGPSGACAASTSAAGRKRKTEDAGPLKTKRTCEWLGVDNLSDLDSDTDTEDNQSPGPSAAANDADSGTMSEPHSGNTDEEGHSDSGVESVEGQRSKVTHRLENMDIDSDSSPRDSAVLSDSEKLGSEAMGQTDSDAGKSDSEMVTVETTSSQQDTVGSGGAQQDTASSGGAQLDTASSGGAQQNTASSGGARPKTHSLLTALPPPQAETGPDPMEPVDLDQYSSASELEALGLDRLKQALTVRGLKCGGTLQQRAERFFSVKGLTPDQISPALLAKPAKGKKKR